MEAANVVLIFGPIMPLVVGFLKHLFPSSNPRVLVAIVCAFIAIPFGVSILFFDEIVLENFLAQLTSVTALIYAIGTSLYKLGKSKKYPSDKYLITDKSNTNVNISVPD